MAKYVKIIKCPLPQEEWDKEELCPMIVIVNDKLEIRTKGQWHFLTDQWEIVGDSKIPTEYTQSKEKE